MDIKKIAAAPKNFVVKHKTAILVTVAVTSVAAAVTFRTGLVQHDEFLKEHDLYDTFYDLNTEI
jgi:hypothetical protein